MQRTASLGTSLGEMFRMASRPLPVFDCFADHDLVYRLLLRSSCLSMFPTAALTSVLLLALSVAATAKPVVIRDSPVTLPFAKSVNITGPLDLVRKDKARAQALRARAQAKINGEQLSSDAVVGVPVANQATVYTANVGIGSPATTYSLLIDTGSSNTWVGAGQAYRRTSTSTQTNDRVSVTYGSGSFSGTEFTDQVTLASGLVIPKQSIGVASRSQGFQGFDGILGIGPTDLTEGTLSPDTRSSIPTVTDNLFSQGTISSNLVAVSFEPTTSVSAVTNGELSFGGTDSSKFTGSINFSPLTRTSPASEFWGIDQSIKYGSTTILSETAGIVDTGTTLVLIASDAFSRYRSATGGVEDNNTGLLRLSTSQFNNLQSLFFTTGGATFELTANAQAWPRSLNSAIGGTSNNVYLIVNDVGTRSGEGLDFINGFTFLERFYSVFDTANKRVGFATTSFTHATTN